MIAGAGDRGKDTVQRHGRVADFDFDLPSENIALRPVRPRDAARLLVVRSEDLKDCKVHDLPMVLRRGDCLVFNDTRVIPAQLEGRCGEAKIRATLYKSLGSRRWQAFIRNAKRVRCGDTLDFGLGVCAVAQERCADGGVILAFAGEELVEAMLERAGMMPLPPYIAGKRPVDTADKDDYQTIFARKKGAVAAPTAALHFTSELVAHLLRSGIGSETLTLHVGAGTFLPVRTERLADHVMHAETGEILPETAKRINAVRANGGRIIAVGTSTLRLLENATDDTAVTRGFAGDTRLFITPGYRFKAVDGLMTNFHLPKSTLFMLVSALMGAKRMRETYTYAIAHGYRFYSYGDSSLLLPGNPAPASASAPVPASAI